MKAMLAGFVAAIAIAIVAGLVLTSLNVSTGERYAPPDSVRLK